MSEQPAPADLSAWLTGQGADAYALAWVADADDPLDTGTGTGAGADVEGIAVGESGIARPGFDPARFTLQEVTRGRAQALSR
ncbi:hypothetical protein ACIF8T_40455 [Streptomyces sp. NPDC085946]|uniref:hypothetical protein n=1 Tax=Streptomyces sp. NPDC085946 TaxID=3365744 RepID=UPI0037D23D97